MQEGGDELAVYNVVRTLMRACAGRWRDFIGA